MLVKGPNGKECTIKKDMVIKANVIENVKPLDKIIKADKVYKSKLKLDREEGVDSINIIKEPRRKKVVVPTVKKVVAPILKKVTAPNNINGDIANDNIIVGKRVRKVINN